MGIRDTTEFAVEYNEWLCPQPGNFQEVRKLLKVRSLNLHVHEKKADIHRSGSIKEIEPIIPSLNKMQMPGPESFTGKFYQTFRGNRTSRLSSLPEYGSRENTANSFCRTGGILMPKPEVNQQACLWSYHLRGWSRTGMCSRPAWDTNWDLDSKRRKKRTEYRERKERKIKDHYPQWHKYKISNERQAKQTKNHTPQPSHLIGAIENRFRQTHHPDLAGWLATELLGPLVLTSPGQLWTQPNKTVNLLKTKLGILKMYYY